VSAIGILVEHSTRFVLLCHLERIKSEHVVAQLTHHVQTLPDQLRRSVTWEPVGDLGPGQGDGPVRQLHHRHGRAGLLRRPQEPLAARHQRNTNGLLRQYFPKRSDHKPYNQADLDAIAAELNGRPRKTSSS
jgi:transposase, IS30 family